MAQRMTDAEPILAKSGVVIEKIDGWIYYGLGFPPGKPIFLGDSEMVSQPAAGC